MPCSAARRPRRSTSGGVRSGSSRRGAGSPYACTNAAKAPVEAVTSVTFRALDDATLDWYVATGEWEGRAGGYAIQGRGAALVAGIEGDYLNVVGLPLARLLDLRPDLLPATPPR